MEFGVANIVCKSLKNVLILKLLYSLQGLDVL